MRLLKPWPDPHTVNPNGKYGNRRHPISGRTKKHRGLDVAYSGLIYAPADGEVVHKADDWHAKPHWQQQRDTGGNTLIIKHAPDLYTVYYHLSRPSKLAVGAKVRTGDVLGHTGTTGASTGVHLHWETRSSRRWGADFDPHTVTDMTKSAANGATPDTSATPAEPAPLKVDGVMGANTWLRFQSYLKDKGYYKGRVDGIPGRLTYKAVQSYLNEVA
jgi:murein DD-endopeptidase MepM/ murein hydrolase activator NlpD